ncbi:MAG: alpha/beta hydrolase [Herpetosiphonaceae bacterium]|nr:alpha/beta hydrolase [Herpetosiphonaceae bacterium]
MSYPSDTRTTKITLRDGRSLGYAEFGAPTGKPIFLFNGSASRRFYPFDDGVDTALGARVITVERPGIGLSDVKAKRTLLDWPADVQELADQLGIERFAVGGGSAGGPYAAACAYRLPERVTTLALISSLAPFNVPEVTKGMNVTYRILPFLIRHAPWFLNFAQSLAADRPEMVWKQFYKRLPKCDKAILRAHPNIDLKALLVNDMPEIYRQGPQGIVADMAVLTGPWGFSPADIRVKTKIWQGDQDVNVPPAMAHYLARSIPNAQLAMIPNEGHVMYINHWDEILQFLVRD